MHFVVGGVHFVVAVVGDLLLLFLVYCAFVVVVVGSGSVLVIRAGVVVTSVCYYVLSFKMYSLLSLNFIMC